MQNYNSLMGHNNKRNTSAFWHIPLHLINIWKVSLKKCKTTVPWWDIVISGILLTYSFTSEKHLKSLTQVMQNYSSLMGHNNTRNISEIFLYIWKTSETTTEQFGIQLHAISSTPWPSINKRNTIWPHPTKQNTSSQYRKKENSRLIMSNVGGILLTYSLTSDTENRRPELKFIPLL